MEYRVPLTSYDGTLAASSTGALLWELEQGHIVKGIEVKLGGTFVAADIAELSLKLGGKDLLPPGLTGADWQDILDYLGYVADAAFILIPFTDFLSEAFNPAQARIGEIDTTRAGAGKANQYTGFQLKVVPDGTQSSSPTIEVQMVCETAVKPVFQVPGLDRDFYDTADMVRAWTYADVALNSANAYNPVPMNIGTDYRNNLVRTFIYNAYQTKFRVRLGDRIISPDQLATYIAFLNKAARRRVPQSGQFVMDYSYGGNNLLALDMTNDTGNAANFKVEGYVTTAETVRVINEILAPWARV